METHEERQLGVFLLYAKEARNWSGTPPIGLGEGQGSFLQTRQGLGMVGNLKREGFLTTFLDSGGRERVSFTDAGKALAAEHGVEIDDPHFREAVATSLNR